mgnify:CR=1 FL=1
MMGWKVVKTKLSEIKTIEEMEKIVIFQQKLIGNLQEQIDVMEEHLAVLARACHIQL